MKKLILASALALAGLAASTVTAATTLAAAGFNVNVALTSACVLTTPPTDINLAYTSFATGTVSNTTSAVIKCTTSLPYTTALSATGATADGIAHTVAIAANGGTGTGSDVTHTITATITGPQAGTCASAVCNSVTPYTLTVGY